MWQASCITEQALRYGPCKTRDQIGVGGWGRWLQTEPEFDPWHLHIKAGVVALTYNLSTGKVETGESWPHQPASQPGLLSESQIPVRDLVSKK